MSRIVHEVVEAKSDLTGKPATESRTFAVNGVTYELDLTEQEAGVFDRTLAKYTHKARIGSVEPGVLRDWARSQGYEVGVRGRLAGDLQGAFAAAMRGESVNGHAETKETAESVDA